MINRKIKRAVSLCTVAAMAASLTGCGNQETAGSKESTPAETTTGTKSA